MDDNIKQYADVLYEQSQLESARTLRDERARSHQEMAARRSGHALPLSGPEIQVILNLFAQHVERCMEARLESYRIAYGEAKQAPTDSEFSEILTNVKQAQELEIKHSAVAVGDFIRSNGMDMNMDVAGNLNGNTAQAHDRLLGEWKVWRGQVQLSKVIAPDDRKFARLALDEARKSVPEKDGRAHPLVGAIVVRDGSVLATAHRGEAEGNHAEYIALERKLGDTGVAGATVYTTLEPCTTRNHPKIPCADRLIERKVKRVVIGMLDPDPRITGRGQRKLRSANIITDFFPHDLMTEVEDLNREFTRQFDAIPRAPGSSALATAGAVDNTPHPGTDSVDKWVSLGYEQKSGIANKLNEQGFELGWVSADKEVEKIEFDHWEYVVVDQPDGKRARLKIHDHPAVGGYLVLLKRRRTSK